jgi:hypothetical protein
MRLLSQAEYGCTNCAGRWICQQARWSYEQNVRGHSRTFTLKSFAAVLAAFSIDYLDTEVPNEPFMSPVNVCMYRSLSCVLIGSSCIRCEYNFRTMYMILYPTPCYIYLTFLDALQAGRSTVDSNVIWLGSWMVRGGGGGLDGSETLGQI